MKYRANENICIEMSEIGYYTLVEDDTIEVELIDECNVRGYYNGMPITLKEKELADKFRVVPKRIGE